MRCSTLTLTCVLFASAMGCATRSTPQPAVAPEAEAEATPEVAPLPQWNFDPAMIFPADRSLFRPEDGVLLPDGRLIVSDQQKGLREVQADGSSEPFGNLTEVGYSHEPPENAGGANSVSIEPAGTHLLVADVYRGGIYRVDIASGASERVYQHNYGVNTAIRDSTGAIWFTQSAHNPPEAGEARMWVSIDKGTAEGALYRLAMEDGQLAKEPTLVVDGLFFANGFAIDEANGHLYLAETVAGRVSRYDVNLEEGTVGEPSAVVEGKVVDNLELDGEGRLWIAAPLPCELLILDTTSGEVHSAFAPATEAQMGVAQQFASLGQSGESRLGLLTPAAWEPLPAMITGIILPVEEGPIYLSGLGDALLKLQR
ncbi:MAG: SMP-30/gluconolactonase/LRE family protein [Myxococcota bacterium]